MRYSHFNGDPQRLAEAAQFLGDGGMGPEQEEENPIPFIELNQRTLALAIRTAERSWNWRLLTPKKKATRVSALYETFTTWI